MELTPPSAQVSQLAFTGQPTVKGGLIHLEPIMKDIILESVLTCPHCGFSKQETMPTDACQFYYEYEQCKTLLRPKLGDCCVFCSYGTVQCPPVQQAGKGCCSG